MQWHINKCVTRGLQALRLYFPEERWSCNSVFTQTSWDITTMNNENSKTQHTHTHTHSTSRRLCYDFWPPSIWVPFYNLGNFPHYGSWWGQEPTSYSRTRAWPNDPGATSVGSTQTTGLASEPAFVTQGREELEEWSEASLRGWGWWQQDQGHPLGTNAGRVGGVSHSICGVLRPVPRVPQGTAGGCIAWSLLSQVSGHSGRDSMSF